MTNSDVDDVDSDSSHLSSESEEGTRLTDQKKDGDEKSKIKEAVRCNYNAMIVMAIKDSAEKRLFTKAIYEYILKNFPQYQDYKHGWKRSLRVTLNRHKYFVKVPRREGDKDDGNYWILNQLSPKENTPLPQPLSASSSVFSNMSEQIINLSRNVVRKNDVTQPNVYAKFFGHKEKAKSETKKENLLLKIEENF